MNRLQKKCLIVSASCHGLLLLVLLVGPAFFTPTEKANSTQLLKMVSGKIVDDAMSSGGRPNTQEAPPQAQPPPVANPEVVKPVEPIKPPVQSRPVDRPQPPMTRDFTPVKQQKTKPVEADKNEFQVVDRKTPPSNPKPSQNKSSTDAKPTQAADNSKQIAAVLGKINGLKSDISSTVNIEFNGQGNDSDAAVANYADIVRSFYYNAWSAPFSLLKDPGPVRVRVTISRDGQVTRSEIITRSGDVDMDKSIQNALDKVNFIAPFPPNAKDMARSYTIKFNLADKRSL